MRRAEFPTMFLHLKWTLEKQYIHVKTFEPSVSFFLQITHSKSSLSIAYGYGKQAEVDKNRDVNKQVNYIATHTNTKQATAEMKNEQVKLMEMRY